MSEHSDVCVRIASLVEWVDQHRCARRKVSADHEPAGLLQFGFEPGKEGDQCARIQYALALQAIQAQRLRGEVAVEHSETAGLDLAENGPSCGLHPDGSGLQLVQRCGCQS